MKNLLNSKYHFPFIQKEQVFILLQISGLFNIYL